MADEKNAEPVVHSKVTFFKIDGEQSIRSNASEYEDDFKGLYGLDTFHQGVHVIEPPYNVKQLMGLCQNNNTLQPCIDAIVTNVHGTGWEIEPEEEPDSDAEEDKKIEELTAFFEQPYPGLSWTTMRKQLGQDVEKAGHGYLEVIRNLKGEMVFVRRLDPKLIRLVKLDPPRDVKMQLTRRGTTFEATVGRRFRRFAQLISGKKVFFKEYGCPTKLHKRLGLWEGDGVHDIDKVEVKDLATEIIYFTKMLDSETPYGIPAWVTQTPSVLGSRRAEEQNLAYFDNGGVPPMMVFVSGGQMAQEARDAIQNFMAATPDSKQVVPVIEVWGDTGTDGKAGNVKIDIERFGSERQSDSMFENYDERCETRIRRAWRLPPIFVGGVEEYNFATAFASYTSAEAQVFSPERQEFDEVINSTIMVELGAEGYKYRSKPMTVHDIQHQLKAVELAWGSGEISGDQFLKVLNELTGLNMMEDAPEEEPLLPAPEQLDAQGNPIPASTDPNQTPAPAQSTPSAPPNRQKLASDFGEHDPTTLASQLFEAMVGDNDLQVTAPILAKVFSLPTDEAAEFKHAFLEALSEGAVTANDDMAAALAASMLAGVSADET
jgi:PBSX family phage portal protein